MNYEEKGLKEWKVIILIRMYKDSNFFSIAGFFRFPLLFLSSSHSLALFLPFSFSLAHSLAPPSPHAHTHAHTIFLSFFLSHPSIFIIQLQTNTLSYPPPSPFFIHASISFTYTIAWPGTGSRSEGTSIVRLLLRHRYQICINDEIKSWLE